MRYAAIDSDERPTGALYDRITPAIQAHHAGFGETLIPVQDLVENDGVWEIIPAAIEQIRESMVVSRFQARAALREAGLLDQVDELINSSGDDLMVDAWAAAAEIRRLSPMIVGMGGALGLSEEDIDGLFRSATNITV